MKRIFTILILIYGNIFAEITTLSLSNAIELALKNNISIAQFEKDMLIAEAQYKQAFSDLYMPSISLSASFTLLDPKTVDNAKIATPTYGTIVTNMPVLNGGIPTGEVVPVPMFVPTGVTTNQTAFQDNYGVGLSITKPLFTGFKLMNNSKIKKLNYELSKQKYEDKKREIITTISTSFYNLLLVKENIRVINELDRSLKERWNYAESAYKAGIVSEYDKIRAEVAYKNNQPNLIKLNNAYKTAKINFLNQIGLTNYDEVELYGNILDSTNIVVNVTFEEALQRAISNDINLKSIEVSIETLKISREINSSAKYPTVAAFFNYKYDYKKEKSTDEERKWIDSWSTGIQLSMPIDPWIPESKTQYADKEIEENTKKLELTKKQIIDGITLQVQNIFLQIAQSKELIASQSESVRQARLGLDIANRRYRSGASSTLEVTDAEVSYNQAQLNYLQAIYEYFSNELQLKKIIGE
ncbi:MAG: TolC family protein [Brevinematales bacterium]|nr:TolC family protein [Brevinematales bacterium]